ncbi:cohesin domain-containing protein [Clostridium ljungdahlii]|uniref:cohesin domain-containing protein n=1 Tax=Clostridium ljungdahlii TaxID=1538 RepID=UPI0038696BBB
MKKFYKHLGIVFVMAFAVIIGCFSNNVFAADDGVIGTSNLNGTAENNAKLGDVLSNPEKGWKRYDDTNSDISYLGQGWQKYNTPPSYNSTETICRNLNTSIKFNFFGSKLRYIYAAGPQGADNVTVKIDGIVDNTIFTRRDILTYKILLYEKVGLEKKSHTVEIIDNSSTPINYFGLDAIDIDEDGYLIDPSVSQGTVLNIEPEKTKIKKTETVSANLTIDNIKDIAAEDVRIKYDSTKLQFLGADEVDGMKLVKSDGKDGELRFIVASKGSANVVNAKKTLLKLNFKGIAAGDALVDVTKGRVSDGITTEEDLTDEQCGQATITIEDSTLKDVNNSGEFTLLDLAIDGRHYGKLLRHFHNIIQI